MSLDLDPNHIFRDFVTDGIPASGKYDPRKAEIRQHLSSIWQAVIALLADADPGLTLPNLLIRATDTGAGAPNAIKADTNLPIPAGDSTALIALNIFEANSGSPVTVSFNGGPALTVKTNSGNDVSAGGLAAGMIVLGYVTGDTFRVVTDQVSAAIVVAAEDAADRAEAAAATVNLPAIQSGDAGKTLFVNPEEDGYVLDKPASTGSVQDRLSLKSADTEASKPLFLAEDGREGTFIWREGDYSSQLATDVVESTFVAADEVSPGLGAWIRTVKGPFYAKDAGVSVDNDGGVNASAIKNLIDVMKLPGFGGGDLLLPPGEIQIGASGNLIILSVGMDNINFRGQHRDLTVLKFAAGVNNGVIQVNGANGIGFYDLTIDGNRSNNTSAHGLRVGTGGSTGLTIERVKVRQTPAYGVGLQAGIYSGLRVRDLFIEDTGLDGFDMKNLEDVNRDIFIDGMVIRRFGLDTTQASAQAGLDIRGVCHISRVNVYDVGADNGKVGIRLRPGENDDPSGLGGHFSTLRGFRCVGVNQTSGVAAVGIVNDSYRTVVSDGRVEGVYQGIQNNQTRNRYSNIEVQGCNTGWALQDLTGSGLPTRGDRAQITNCSAENCTSHGFDVFTENNQFLAPIARNTARGFRFNASAGSTNRVIGGESSGNTNANSGTAVYRGHGGVADVG